MKKGILLLAAFLVGAAGCASQRGENENANEPAGAGMQNTNRLNSGTSPSPSTQNPASGNPIAPGSNP